MSVPLITIGLILALGATGDNWEVFAVQAIGILIMLLGMSNKIEV